MMVMPYVTDILLVGDLNSDLHISSIPYSDNYFACLTRKYTSDFFVERHFLTHEKLTR